MTHTILHLSDLHFGSINDGALAALEAFVKSTPIDVTVVSGDLTQRARRSEFEAAAAFVSKLPSPRLLVPGNHDIPLFNLVKRFVSRLSRYQRYITPELRPVIDTPDLVIAGVSTAHSMTIKDGRITHSQIKHLKSVFESAKDKIKILVTHHPLHLLQNTTNSRVASRARFALEVLRHCKIDLMLSGHYHQTGIGVGEIHQESSLPSILVQAGTTFSNRLRGENNAFNLIRTSPGSIEITTLEWNTELGNFAPLQHSLYLKDSGGRWTLT